MRVRVPGVGGEKAFVDGAETRFVLGYLHLTAGHARNIYSACFGRARFENTWLAVAGITRALALSLAPTPDAAARARAAIAQLAGLALVPQVSFDVRLLVTELLTNSVRHAGLREDQSVRLLVDLSPRRVRCEIHDAGTGFSSDGSAPARGAVGGWGMHLVERLSDRWGVQRQGGTRVWFEIDLPQ